MRSRRTSQPLFALVIGAAVGLGSELTPATAHAQATNASASPRARAAELFKKSVEAYRSGDFKRTIEMLDEAYALEPQPVLLYNLARAHEGLGNNDAAIDAYERFLGQEPNAKDRGAIEQRLTTLRRQRDERIALEQRGAAQPAPPPPEPPKPPPPEPHRHARSVLPYVVGGVGVAGLVTGAVFGLMATSKRDDAVSAPVQRDALDLESSAKSRATVANVSFVIGGVLVAAGVTWWVLDLKASQQTAGARPMRVGVGPGMVRLEAVFP